MQKGLLALLFLLRPAMASEFLHLDLSTGFSKTPLTMARIWELDPEELNPHRRLWAIQKTVNLVGLKAIEAEGAYRVQVKSLKSFAEILLRPVGPWYQDFSAYPCPKKPDPEFSTQDGAQLAAEKAARFWNEQINLDSNRLAILLKQVSGFSKKEVLASAQQIFETWLKEQDARWKSTMPKVAQKEEWLLYLKQAKKNKFCTGSHAKKDQVVWNERMEKVPESPEKELIVSVPARQWEGKFAILVEAEIDGKKKTGQFALDDSRMENRVSPEWLQKNASSVAIRIHGKDFGSQFFSKSQDLEKFAPPDFAGKCCDGSLGLDFMRKYAVEFIPGLKAEIKFWNREGFGFSAEDSMVWQEVSLKPKSSSGVLKSEVSSKLKQKDSRMVLDLSNGRIWYSEVIPPAPSDLAGVEVRFEEKKGERILKATSVKSNSEFKKKGLTSSAVIETINGIAADELDLWQVKRFLSGAYSDKLTLGWSDQGQSRVWTVLLRRGKDSL